MGCLDGIRVLELGGKGPAPFAGMIFADMGAEVVRCDRLSGSNGLEGLDVLARGKGRIRIDLKSPLVRDALLRALESFDVVIEGFRPGVAERLGLGPDAALAANGRLVYGRMSGYGQGNAYSQIPGHDVNFIAVAGALGHLGDEGTVPPIPLNLVGDFGAGGMLLALGVLAALVERAASGHGQVVDAAMTDGVALLMAAVYGMRAGSQWSSVRGTNLVDGGAPFYNVYETADEKYVAVGAVEPRQYADLVRACQLPEELLAGQYDRSTWPESKRLFKEVFRLRDRREWTARFLGTQACYSEVLTMDDAQDHEFHRTRRTFTTVAGVVQPAPAPRFSRTPSTVPAVCPPDAGPGTILRRCGLDEDEVAVLVGKGLAV